jgi:hypothetical protein
MTWRLVELKNILKLAAFAEDERQDNNIGLNLTDARYYIQMKYACKMNQVNNMFA